MNGSVAESLWNGEGVAIDWRACGGGDDGRNMTDVAAYLVKFPFTVKHIRRDRPTRRRLCRSHEVGEGLNICAIVFWFWDGVIGSAKSNEQALRSIFIRKQRTGDAHFIKIRVTCK